MSENNDLVYELNFLTVGNKIRVSCTNEINKSYFTAEQYKGLKDVYQKVATSQNEKIILKKI
ncbi:MAG TPA: hypothetical protein VJ780_07015 [Flavobacterium sp.]|nr:hypothetical protein [Flavobacterium sp.]